MIQIGYQNRYRGKRIFTLEEARQVLPIILRMTIESQNIVRELLNQLQAFPQRDDLRIKPLELEIQTHIQKWQTKVESLGAEPKGLWIADFDNGSGYFCWKFPETQISYFHGYDDGFKNRRHVEDDLFFKDEASIEPMEQKLGQKTEM